MRSRAPLRTALLIPVLVLAATGAQAQQTADDWIESCRQERSGNRERFCEVRELTLPADGQALTVDGRQNGGITVEGWDRNQVLVRARVSSSADTEAEARAQAANIQILTEGRTVRAEGPNGGRRNGWSVSYQVFVPRTHDLALRANNGGISVDGVRGRINAETTNGGLSLQEVSGDVRGRTTNGGVDVRLAGDRWQGEGLDVETTNGGIDLQIPRGYSARLVAGTTNGRVNTDFPITVQGSLNRNITAQLGGGGPTIRAVTTNGGVNIQERDS